MRHHVTLLALGTLLLAADASAFCRTRICDALFGDCTKTDADGCFTDGAPLFWGRKLEIWVDDGGSPLRGITAEQTLALMKEAANAWTSVSCPSGKPLELDVQVMGIRADGEAMHDFDVDTPDLNTVNFVDRDWKHVAADAGGTFTLSDPSTGLLREADIEVNTGTFPLEVHGPAGGPADLGGVLTHELGHALGMAHSKDPAATMRRSATTDGFTDLRTLGADDVAGICAIYEQGASRDPGPTATPDYSPAPYDSGSCSVSRTGSSGASGTGFLAVTALFAVRRRRTPRLGGNGYGRGTR